MRLGGGLTVLEGLGHVTPRSVLKGSGRAGSGRSSRGPNVAQDRQLKQIRRQKTPYDLEFLMSGPNGI